MFRFRSMNSIRFATTRLVLLRPVRRDLVTGFDSMPLKPLLLPLSAAIRSASKNSNARSPKLDIRNGPGRRHQVRRFLIGDEAVPVVDVPVQLLLQRDHPPADVLMLGPCCVQSFPRRQTLSAQTADG